MELRSLNVLHWRAAGAAPAIPSTIGGADALFEIHTCQRRLGVLLDASGLEAARGDFPADGALEHCAGVAAYALLLRVCCGLESKLVAETEIFGQIKQAWQSFAAGGSDLARQLSACMQQLFRDAKEIRAQHLSRLGSISYGSQVRRLLGDPATAAGPTLLLGAGQIAQSVAPWLTGSELWLWNRTATRAQELALELAKRSPERPVRVIGEGCAAERAAWRGAHQVVI